VEGARSGRTGGRRVARRKRLSSGVHGSVRESRVRLHAFQKKSPSGIRTAKRDVELVAERLKTAERFMTELLEKIASKQLLLQCLQDSSIDFVSPNRQVIRTSSLVASSKARQPIA
jgi:hypothetical protein